jgi:hypothetical protein
MAGDLSFQSVVAMPHFGKRKSGHQGYIATLGTKEMLREIFIYFFKIVHCMYCIKEENRGYMRVRTLTSKTYDIPTSEIRGLSLQDQSGILDEAKMHKHIT